MTTHYATVCQVLDEQHLQINTNTVLNVQWIIELIHLFENVDATALVPNMEDKLFVILDIWAVLP